MSNRVVLAYSGGLDTSVAVKWMAEQWDSEVIALAIDVGQGGDFEAVRERALAAGAVEAEVVDARERFGSDFVAPLLRANALYEGRYPLVSALSRPIIVECLVAAARRYGATAVAHGCTGKGNDQVRFEVSTRALAPDLDVLAPVRVWDFNRETAMDYAAAHGIPIEQTKKSPYSIDENLWGRAIECGAIEDPWAQPPADIWTMTRPPGSGPPEPSEVVIRFEAGIPVALDGTALPVFELVTRLNDVVGAYGFGRIDMVENRRVGIKSRECYEAPGALALILAHSDLEGVTLERDVMREKARLEPRYAELVYDGLWHSPLRSALDAFMVATQEHVTGEVRLRLEAGRRTIDGRRAERGLYDHGLATYDASDTFRHADAEGFVRLWGLSVETWARRQGVQGQGGSS
jgi:argininosuccinate synthase